MIKLSKKDYYGLLDDCRCKACICSNSCYQEGKGYNISNADCKDNALLVKGHKQIISKAKLEIQSKYQYK